MKMFKDEWLIKPLLKSGILSTDILNKLRAGINDNPNIFLYDKVISRGYITEEQICNLLAKTYHLPVVNMESLKIDKKAVDALSKEICHKHKVFPFSINEDCISVVVFDPVNLEAENEIAFMSSRLVKPVIGPKSQIEEKISEYYNPENYVDDLPEKLSDTNDSLGINTEEMEDEKIETNMAAPIVKLVNSILNDAIDKTASDIHIEPVEKKLMVRFRIDGMLKKIMEIPKYASAQLLARIKVISKLDVAETRKPQDGQAKLVRNGVEIDLRVSVLPTTYGEKAVIRILDSSRGNIPFEDLGITGENLEKLNRVMTLKQGIILATGPTGSGKTSTLYAALNHIKSPTTNILTIEDPIEYTIEGINQVQVNEKSGISFATALRSFLRQDPDVILVGEIRDHETAEISIRASLTGHLVLSTIHTNSAVDTITRLIDIGIDRYKVSSALTAIIAQRLVRRICPRCKQEIKPGIQEQSIIPMMEQKKLPIKFYKGSGCMHCDFSGYKGRIGIYEILIIDNELRELINNGASVGEIENFAINKGFKNFTHEALSVIANGISDFTEVSRIISIMADAIPIEENRKKQDDQHTDNKKSIVEHQNNHSSAINSINQTKSKTKILVVEDDNIMRRIVTSFLKKEEIYEVTEAVDGVDALQMVSKNIPDLILLDILMPKMDGYEVCRHLRNDSKYAQIPIIMLSSLEDKEDLVKGFDLGIDDYISKPVDQKVLSARVNALLRRVDQNKS